MFYLVSERQLQEATEALSKKFEREINDIRRELARLMVIEYGVCPNDKLFSLATEEALYVASMEASEEALLRDADAYRALPDECKNGHKKGGK